MFKLALGMGLSTGCFVNSVCAVPLEVSKETAQSLAEQKPATAEQELELFYNLQIRGTAAMKNAKRIYYGKRLDNYGALRLPTALSPFLVESP